MYLNPKWIICDFLRNHLTDPRTTRIYTLKSELFTGSVGRTVFTVSPNAGKTMSHVLSVTVNGDLRKKWRDYYIDFRAQSIVFYDGMAGGEAVIINYKESSTDWIYWDKPDIELTDLSFPRMTVQVVAGSGSRLGEYEAPVESSVQFQVDVWCKEKAVDQIFNIDGRNYTGEDLAEYIAYAVMQACEDNENELHPVLYDYTPTQVPPRDLPFNEQYQAHHKIVEFIFKGISVGRTN